MKFKEIDKEEFKTLILQGKTIKELQVHYGNVSRSTITEAKRHYGFVGLSPNSKKLDRDCGFKVCLSCKESKPLTEFYSNGISGSGIIKYKSRCIKCSNLDSKDRFEHLVYEYLEYNGLTYTCSICNFTGTFGILDFHHLDPSIKEFNIGSVPKSLSKDNFWSTVVPELDKCVLLCPTCHRLEHLSMGLK